MINMSRRRVVVTGLGCVSPVGNTVDTTWANLLAGQSGIGLITKFDPSTFSSKVAGEVKGFDVESYMSAKEARTMDTFIHFGIAAAAQALEQQPRMVFVIVGEGEEGYHRELLALIRREGVEGMEARCLQHEMDHLEGVLFVDRISPAARSLVQGKLRKLAQSAGR